MRSSEKKRNTPRMYVEGVMILKIDSEGGKEEKEFRKVNFFQRISKQRKQECE